MFIVSIFDPPESGKDWNACKVGDIADVISYEYEKFFNGAGTFTLEIPINSVFREKIAVNSVLVTNDGDELIVKNIQTMLKSVKITGYDLNGLLCDRLTLYSGDDSNSDGSDIFSGTTEACVKHYVAFNLADCTLDENRNFPRFGVADDQGRGIANDHNNPRLQSVHDVVCEMCAAAKLGWRVGISTTTSSDNTAPLFIFDVAEQVDKSANQSERNRVIFSVQQHNVTEMTREVGVTAAKNALYLDIDGTVVAYPNGSGEDTDREVKSGFDRREEYCSISGDSMEAAEYSVEAEHNMADRMTETDSLTIDAGNPLDYRTLYDVGDVVTVYDKNRSLELDSVISAVKVRRSGSEYSVTLTLGDSKPKLLDSYQKKNEATATTVRQNKVISVGGTALSQYEFLTDDSVKYNGLTYTIEKDADTGLISKISDSNNNYFEPTINSGITDVALHNSVFWAVAMHSGLSKKAKTDITILTGETGALVYDGISGFTAVNLSAQSSSKAHKQSMSDGTAALMIEKNYGMPYSQDGYTDAFIIRSNEKIDLTDYKTIRFVGTIYHNNLYRTLTSAAYFRTGEPEAAQANVNYDFAGWELIGKSTYASTNYTNPGNEKTYEIDISDITGKQYLNLAVFHGHEQSSYSTYFNVKKIELLLGGT